jgi:hypothetical protein
MAAPYTGQCLCGALRFRVDEEPYTVYACHCSDCQRRTGSAFGLSMIVRREAVTLLQGTPSPYSARLADGRTKSGQLCPQCGSRVWGEPKNPAVLVVQAGLLDSPHGLAPVAHQWMSEAQPWVLLPENVPRYEEGPTDPLEMARLWRHAHPLPSNNP